MFKVRAVNHAGRDVTFACGTSYQALDKATELGSRGFTKISILDPKGKEYDTKELERFVDLD